MNKPIVKNWMRYWVSTLAVSGMLVMGAACDSEKPAEDTRALERENVTNTQVEEPVVVEEEVAVVQEEQTAPATTQTTNRNRSGWGGSSANINRLLKQYPEVNNAIENTLAEYTDEGNANFAQQDGSQNNQNMSSDNMGENGQTGVAYDNMSNQPVSGTEGDDRTNTMVEGTESTNTDMNTQDQNIDRANPGTNIEETAPSSEVIELDPDIKPGDGDADVNTDQTDTDMTDTQSMDQTNTDMTDTQTTDQTGTTYDNMSNANTAEDSYIGVYDNASANATDDERRMMDEMKADYETRRQSQSGQMDTQLQAYYFPAQEARPDVNFSELVEEIKEEMRLPQELEDAKTRGTLLVQFIVDEKGDISNAEVIDGVISQVKEDGTLMSIMRLTDDTKEGVVDEIENEELIEFKGEGKDKLMEALNSESLRALQTTSGKWQPAEQDGQPVKMVVVLPITFDVKE